MNQEYNFFNDSEDINQIDEKLWLGNLFASLNFQDLKKKGITKILTIMDGPLNDYNEQNGFINKKVEIHDLERENIIQYFGECLNFIKGNQNVLVHCGAGVSRSATIVIAYIMWKYRMTFDDALLYVLEKRHVAWPNSGFKEQLRIFEKLLIQNNYDINKINFKAIKWKWSPPPQEEMYSNYL